MISPTISSPSPIAAASTNVAIGSGLNAACPPARTTGCSLGAPVGVQRDAREVERGEQVGVAELGGEADAEDVERADRAVRVDGERGHAVLAHQRLEVGPNRVATLGQRVGPLVEQLVEDLDALVGQADLVGVGVEQRPADGRGLPRAWSAR